MESIKINGGTRAGLGKVGSKADRASKAIPCVLYGGSENVHFTTTWNDVRHLIYTADFKLADITADGKNYSAIVKEVQFHPVHEAILHIDFLLLTPGTPIKVNLPLRIVGQSPGVKAGGKLLQSMRKIKVKVLPENLVNDTHQFKPGLRNSVVIGILAQSVPKKRRFKLFVAKWNEVLRKTGISLVLKCPSNSVVLGDVSDIGESVRSLRTPNRYPV